MPDLSGFVTPEQNFEGLYRAADSLERKNYRESQMQQQRNAQKATTGRHLTDYLDPKEHLSGSPYDPQVVGGFNQILQEGMALANEGADYNTIVMALAPKVGKLSQYANKAKLVNQRLKDQLSKIPSNTGYDISKLEEQARKSAFYNPDGTIKEITSVDPNYDYLTETIRTSPHLVTTDKGLRNWADKFPKMDRTDNIETEDKYGNKTKKKLQVKAAGWEMPEEDAEGNISFVPKHQIATDNGKPIVHEFTKPDGSKVSAPVRVVDEEVFMNLMNSDPSAADFIRGLTQEAIQSGEYKDGNGKPIDINSPQAMLLARGLTYDYLKTLTGGVVSESKVTDYSPQQIRINLTGSAYAPRGGSGSGGDGTNINDVYTSIANKVARTAEDGKSKGARWATRINSLTPEEQTIVVDLARKITGDSDLSNADIVLLPDESGRIGVYWSEVLGGGKLTENLITELDTKSVNLKAQPSVKEKREVIGQGSKTGSKSQSKEKLSW